MNDLFTHMIICRRTTNVVNIAQYCAILRNIVRQNWACTAFVLMQFNVCTVRPTYILAIEKDIWIASTAANTTLILAAALLLLWRLRRNKRRVWIREILCKQRQEGAHHLLIPQLMSNELSRCAALQKHQTEKPKQRCRPTPKGRSHTESKRSQTQAPGPPSEPYPRTVSSKFLLNA